VEVKGWVARTWPARQFLVLCLQPAWRREAPDAL